jgi:putative transposase
MALDKELIDKLLADYQKPEDIIGENGLLKQLTKAVIERAMSAELTHHLGYEKNKAEKPGKGNSRNGTSRKTLKGDFGEVEIEVPRDRAGTFEPQIVAKHQRRFDGFDDKILSMYARGMSTREIQGHLQEIYGVDVSASLISDVTDGVMEEVRQWQGRPLEPLYAIVYFDALFVKMRHEGRIQNRAVYVAIGVRLDGNREVLGFWTDATEGAKFWLVVMTDLNNRGLKDIFIACVDGLKGFPEAIQTVYPKALVQLCIVHLLRNSFNYVDWRDRKAVARDLKQVYSAPTADMAEQELRGFEEKWGKRYAAIVSVWERNWPNIIPFFSFPAEIRKIIYTTNTVEGLNRAFRKIIKSRGAFPSEEAALKLLYLAMKNAASKWESVRDWRSALNQFALLWDERIQTAFPK